jgi:acetyltransferase-like isoleucine patch superfamily enzyme
VTEERARKAADEMQSIGRNVTLSADTVLGQGVRIGNNVTVYPGVTIGDRCTVFDGAVLGRPPMACGTTNRPVDTSARKLMIGRDCVIGCNAVLYHGTTVGDHVLVGDLASIREGCALDDHAVVGRGVMVMYDTRVGARSRIIDGAILTGNMTIEPDVFIGPGATSINDNDVYLKRFGLAPFEVRGPIVRRFALVGTGACLAAGIEVGIGAIVAPAAVVTADVPAWTVVAGIPARRIRTVESADRERLLGQLAPELLDLTSSAPA